LEIAIPDSVSTVRRYQPVGSGPAVQSEREETLQVAPNLIWPSDHSWIAVSEYDFDSTLVAGDESLIGALIDDHRLETYRVDRDDSLAADSDIINSH
jgi:hypothetical protein